MYTKRKFPTWTKSKSGFQFNLSTFHVARFLRKENSGKRVKRTYAYIILTKEKKGESYVSYDWIG